jgi:hypothetical protein
MSEQLKHSGESARSRGEQESAASRAERARHIEQLEAAGREQAEHQAERIAKAREVTEREETKAEKRLKPEPVEKPEFHVGEKSQAKKTAYKQSLKRIQSQLPTKRSRAFSRVIHNRAVENISEVAGKTVFRPSITLGLSLGALIGGTGIYLIARHYGYGISGSEFLFAGLVGGVIGIIVEVIYRLGKRVFGHSAS